MLQPCESICQKLELIKQWIKNLIFVSYALKCVLKSIVNKWQLLLKWSDFFVKELMFSYKKAWKFFLVYPVFLFLCRLIIWNYRIIIKCIL